MLLTLSPAGRQTHLRSLSPSRGLELGREGQTGQGCEGGTQEDLGGEGVRTR